MSLAFGLISCFEVKMATLGLGVPEDKSETPAEGMQHTQWFGDDLLQTRQEPKTSDIDSFSCGTANILQPVSAAG